MKLCNLVSLIIVLALFLSGPALLAQEEPAEPPETTAAVEAPPPENPLIQEEEKVLTDMLNQVRMAYVKIAG